MVVVVLVCLELLLLPLLLLVVMRWCTTHDTCCARPPHLPVRPFQRSTRPSQIDAGASFGFRREYNRFTQTLLPLASRDQRLADPRDLQFGNQLPRAIEWAKLSMRQRCAFLRALLRGSSS